MKRYWGLGALLLFSCPGVMAGPGASFLLSAIPELSASLGGLAAFDPDGSPAAPEALGSGVSAAKAAALLINMAAANIKF